MPTRTRFVFLMHPKEYKREKAATGRLTHLCLPNSEIVMGVELDAHPRLRDLLCDPTYLPVLLFPGRNAINLSTAGPEEEAFLGLQQDLQQRRLLVLIIDATWALGRKMLKLSPGLQRLPRVMFTPTTPSRYRIKQQPAVGCLSTLEAVHELLIALQTAKLDEYPLPDQLLTLFDRMQGYQIQCATEPGREGYRRHGYRAPGERRPYQGHSARRRAKLFEAPAS